MKKQFFSKRLRILLIAAVVLAVFLLAMACLVKGTYNPFIYFNF